MEDAEKVLIYMYDMFSIRLIIDRLQKHPYPDTKDSVVPAAMASQTTTRAIDPLLNAKAAGQSMRK
jgi:hypothetical protein